MIYTKAVSVSSKLLSSFAFEDEASRDKWLKFELPKLEAKHGKLKVKLYDLDGLEVGDSCHVLGEGTDVFEIIELIEYSPNRPGFVLDNGLSEEVVKCYKS